MELSSEFWHKVDNSGGPSQCWPWLGSRHEDGYGVHFVNGKHQKAHRIMYAGTVGPIPKGCVIMHTCDNPPCCNPFHLKPGTVGENNKDRILKGRSIGGQIPGKGERHPQSKLTDIQREEIKALSKSGVSFKRIAREYGMSDVRIGHIVKGTHSRMKRPSSEQAPK